MIIGWELGLLSVLIASFFTDTIKEGSPKATK